MAALQTQATILFEVQQACLQLSLPSPAGVYDSTDETALAMGAVANLAGILLADGFNWEHLQGTITCVGDGVTTAFNLPADFGAIIDNTGWSAAIRRPVVVLNAQQWAAIAAWQGSAFTLSPACRIYNDQIVFISAPPVGNITFQYRVKYWVIDGVTPTTKKELLTANADIPRFDWLMMTLAIKVKWLEMKSMSTMAAMADLQDRYLQLTSKDEIAPTLSLSGSQQGSFRYIDGMNLPDTGYG